MGKISRINPKPTEPNLTDSEKDDIRAALRLVADEFEIPVAELMPLTWEVIMPMMDVVEARNVLGAWDSARNVLAMENLGRILAPLPAGATAMDAIRAGFVAEAEVARVLNPTNLEIAQRVARSRKEERVG